MYSTKKINDDLYWVGVISKSHSSAKILPLIAPKEPNASAENNTLSTNIRLFNASMTHYSQIIAESFKRSHIVFALYFCCSSIFLDITYCSFYIITIL